MTLVVMIGDSGVGKTCLVERFVHNRVPDDVMPTVGHEFSQKIIATGKGVEFAVQVWDTAGQEKYKALSSNHYKGAAGALLVFDLTNEKTFRNTLTWLEEFRNYAGENSKVLLVGNKLDLVELDPGSRCVDKKNVENMAQINKITYVETSAAVDKFVNQAFHVLLEGKSKFI